MTSRDDTTKAVMRAYADSLQPPPVAEVIARAERTRDAPPSPSPAQPRPRGRLVLAAASVVVAGAAVTVVTLTAGQPPDRGALAAVPTTASTVSTGAARMAPGCPPDLPLLDGPHDIEGTLVKPISVEAGQSLTLTAQIPATIPDRPLLNYTIYLLPHGVDMNERAKAVSQSPVLQLVPDQRLAAPVLPIPKGLAPGTYDIVGYATFPSPSACGVKNPVVPTDVGTIWGVLGLVVVS